MSSPHGNVDLIIKKDLLDCPQPKHGPLLPKNYAQTQAKGLKSSIKSSSKEFENQSHVVTMINNIEDLKDNCDSPIKEVDSSIQ